MHNRYEDAVFQQVKVKRRGDDQKFLAEVLAIGTECDIALLTVEDEAFWEGVVPLELGPLPRLQVHFSLLTVMLLILMMFLRAEEISGEVLLLAGCCSSRWVPNRRRHNQCHQWRRQSHRGHQLCAWQH